MEIIVRHNSVYLKNANLGKSFSDIVADLTVDNHGRVKVSGIKLSFYTDLDCLSSEILAAISEKLGKEANNRILSKIEKRVKSTIDVQIVQGADNSKN